MFGDATPRHDRDGDGRVKRGHWPASPRVSDAATATKQEPASPCVNDAAAATKQEPAFSANSFCGFSSDLDEMIDSPIPFATAYKLKDPVVVLERCDKIWETLKLIKEIQNSSLDNVDDNEDDDEDSELCDESSDEPAAPARLNATRTSYVKYQPVLSNGNGALPNFALSVKSTKKVYHCAICGKQYIEARSLRRHNLNIHGIVLLPKWQKKNIPHNTGSVGDSSKTTSDENEDSEDAFDQKSLRGESNNKLNKETGPINPELAKGNVSPRSVTQKIIEAGASPARHDLNGPANGMLPKDKERVQSNCSPKESSTGTLKNNVHIQCTLCTLKVKGLEKHLKVYHKITCPNIMMKELGKCLVNKDIEQETRADGRRMKKTSENNNDIVQKNDDVEGNSKVSKKPSDQQYTGESRKRRHTMEYDSHAKRQKLNEEQTADSVADSPYKCDICLGTYASCNSLYKHRKIHYSRGETKENFHTVRCRYLNSPFHKQGGNNNVNPTSPDAEEQSNVDIFTDARRLRSTRVREERSKDICVCGRMFRNPHTLYVHKVTCQTAIDAESESQCAKRNSSDRDSGIGINITIKKRNDSYEIVSKDGSDENKSKDLEHSKDSDLSDGSEYGNKETNNGQTDKSNLQDLESSKYSKDHSILKLEIAEEDIDVDIEEDSQNGASTRSESSKDTAKVQGRDEENAVKEAKENSLRTETPSRMPVPVHQLCRKVSKSTARPAPSAEDAGTVCPCGSEFSTEKSMNEHVALAHPALLACGYCKEKFASLRWYNSHQCKVEQGEALPKPDTHLKCPHCDALLESQRVFDEHIQSSHADPVAPFQCYKCNQRFASEMRRQLHYKDRHCLAKCSCCKAEFHIYRIWLHEAYHRGQGFPCHLCKKAYATKRDLIRHNDGLHNHRSYVSCTVCSKEMTRKAFLVHIHTHKDKQICRLCNLILFEEAALLEHVSKEHPDTLPPVKCPDCNMIFSKTDLDEHVKLKKCSKDANIAEKTQSEKTTVAASS